MALLTVAVAIHAALTLRPTPQSSQRGRAMHNQARKVEPRWLEPHDFKVRSHSTDIEGQAYDRRGWCRPETPRG